MKLHPQTHPFILPLPQHLHLIAYRVCAHMFSVNFTLLKLCMHTMHMDMYVYSAYMTLYMCVHVHIIKILTYSGIPLNGHPSMADTCDNTVESHMLPLYMYVSPPPLTEKLPRSLAYMVGNGYHTEIARYGIPVGYFTLTSLLFVRVGENVLHVHAPVHKPHPPPPPPPQKICLSIAGILYFPSIKIHA